MPLLPAPGSVDQEKTRQVSDELASELREMVGLFAHPLPSAERSSRALTAQELVEATLALREALGAEPRGEALRALVNLEYASVVVAAEYYKMFVRGPRKLDSPNAI